MPDTTPKDPHTLNLSEFARTCKEQGVDMEYSQFSKFINTGDIAEQLGIGGTKGGRKVPLDAVNVLVNFWPVYVGNRGELPQAPGMLHAFLKKGDALVVTPRNEIAPTPSQELAPAARQEIAQAAPVPPTYGYSPTELAAMAVLQGAASQLPLYLTVGEAAKVWRVSAKKFRDVGPPPTLCLGGEKGRGDRWLLSDLLPKAGGK